jgi:hypothetical protein
MDVLIQAKNMGRSDAGTRSADIEGLSEFDEFGSGGINSANKNRNLQTDSWRTSR